MSSKPTTFSEFDDEILHLECFHLYFLPGGITYELKDTSYHFTLTALKKDLIVQWYRFDLKTTFEDVLDDVPAEIQFKLLSGLDLFKHFPSLE